MGHNLEQLGTASLDTFGGLITAANPTDLPEGASPRCWDVDFIIGSVFTRAGLVSIYTFTTILNISSVSVGSSDIATFSYTGNTPTVNEAFVLSNFIGSAYFLNGQTVFVTSVNIVAGTFQAFVTGPFGSYQMQAGTATSITGSFAGPNVPSTAVSTGTGNTWLNPTNALGSVGYASVLSGASTTTPQTPTTAASVGVGGATTQWDVPANLVSLSTPANITYTTGQIQDPVVAYGGPLTVPSTATILGIKVSFQAKSTVFGTSSLNVQLFNGATSKTYGTPVNVPVGTSFAAYAPGSASYTWGTTITPAEINNGDLGVQLTAAVSSGTATLSAYNLVITVTYELAGVTADLTVTNFTFSIPATSGITGLVPTFQAYTVGSTSIVFQLLKNGIAVGTPHTQVLTGVPTAYSLGTPSDLWGSTWKNSDINNTQFGVQITAIGNGTTFVNDLDMLVYITPALVNFNYIKSYVQNNGQTYTLALDASGIMWQENVTSNPDVLSVSLTGILPGSFAQSATMDNREHIMFSDLSIGTERPRVFNGTDYRPLSQIGPGAPPTFTAITASSATPLAVTAYSVTSGVITFTFTAVSTAPVVGTLFVLNGTGNPAIDGVAFAVLGTPAPSTTQFSAAAGSAVGSGSVTATASPTNNYQIASITQDLTQKTPLQPGQAVGGSYYPGKAQAFNGQEQLWGAGPGLTGPGFTITSYYGQSGAVQNTGLNYLIGLPLPVYVYISNNSVTSGIAPLANGTQQILTSSAGTPPSESGTVPYFTTLASTSGNQRHGGPNANFGAGNFGQFQITMAVLTTATAVPNIGTGDTITITGASPSSWNATWTVLDALNSGSYTITSSQVVSTGVVQFGYQNASSFGQPTVTNGQTIALSNMVGNVAFNTTGVVTNATSNTFQITGFSGNIATGPSVIENGQGVTFGSQFLIDPGPLTLGTNTSPIYGDTSVGGSMLVIAGGSSSSIGVGVRQGVVYFITDNEYETQPSSTFEFTTPTGTTQILASNIPIGPPNTIARGIAFTEAGQNGVPGANFYVIMQPVTTTVGAITTVIPSTIINDNTTTQMTFTFPDATLLTSREIDVQGDDLFNLIELGSSGWAVPYAGRMFYGLQLNKINNWTSGGGLTFDAGYLQNGTSNLQPLGWSVANANDQTLIASAVTGQSLYIKNQNAGIQTVGTIWQTAYQDTYNVAIIQTNTAYSVRVACSAPSGIVTGTLVIDLVSYSSGTGFNTNSYGSFSVPLSSMSTVDQVFIGSLLNSEFVANVPPTLVLRVQLLNAAPGADCAIDRIEVFPTLTPYLKAQVYGSYPNQPEAIDASSTGGIIDTTTENAQACMGAFVMRDLLFILKTNSMYSTQDNPNSEPGGWGLHEVSNKVGAIGIHSYDVGEEWALTACRAGIFGFNGGQPTKISQEIWNLWEQINWSAGNTIVLRNDIVNKRMYCAIPLPTGVNPATGIPANLNTLVWLPNAPYNPTPTTPNVMLMLNYQGLATFEEMISSPEMHTTMFGTLAAVDMKRKWAIWNIATPAMQFILEADAESTPLYICNGIGTSKIYELVDGQYSDDGVAINSLYTTYGFVNAAKAATLPIFGFHAKRYTVLQANISGGQATPGSSINPTNAQIRILPNTLVPRYPYTVPVGIPLFNPAQDDFFRPINVRGNRAFVEISTNSVGSWFNISKLLLTGKADAWSTLNPTGGGNTGII